LNDLIDDCTDIRQNYANAKGRREDENALLDEVIKTFVNQVSTVDNKIRSKMSL
jgi:CRISPR/Cas system CSM-associated protein Csm2 small subunit